MVWVEGDPDNAEQELAEEGSWPFRDEVFDAVIDRHEAFRAREAARVLRKDGVFLTQQLGDKNEAELNSLLGAGPPYPAPTHAASRKQLEAAGLHVQIAEEVFPVKVYADVGAIVLYLSAAPWLVVGFSIERFRAPLRRVHERIQLNGALGVHEHRYLLQAIKNSSRSD